MLAAMLGSLLLATAPAPVEQPVAIPAAGGVTLAGTLTLPAGAGPHPAAVLVSGFGPSRRDGSFEGTGGPYADLAAALARRGVAVLRYDKRGLGESGGPALSWLDARPLVRDAVAAVRALIGTPGVDRARVALIGHSQGGDLALAAAPSTGATRVVTLSAPGRPLGQLPRVTGTARRFLDRLVGPDAARATLRTDPRPAAARVRAPVLMVHGTRDRTVPLQDMRALAAARSAAGRTTRTVTVPRAGHFLEVDGRVPPAAIRAVADFVS
ncbi:MAG: alpha/beta hydrolase family protein [Thermoleophilia bacterium]